MRYSGSLLLLPPDMELRYLGEGLRLPIEMISPLAGIDTVFYSARVCLSIHVRVQPIFTSDQAIFGQVFRG